MHSFVIIDTTVWRKLILLTLGLSSLLENLLPAIEMTWMSSLPPIGASLDATPQQMVNANRVGKGTPMKLLFDAILSLIGIFGCFYPIDRIGCPHPGRWRIKLTTKT